MNQFLIWFLSKFYGFSCKCFCFLLGIVYWGTWRSKQTIGVASVERRDRCWKFENFEENKQSNDWRTLFENVFILFLFFLLRLQLKWKRKLLKRIGLIYKWRKNFLNWIKNKRKSLFYSLQNKHQFFNSIIFKAVSIAKSRPSTLFTHRLGRNWKLYSAPNKPPTIQAI